jgi:hypothetical protein
MPRRPESVDTQLRGQATAATMAWMPQRKTNHDVADYADGFGVMFVLPQKVLGITV